MKKHQLENLQLKNPVHFLAVGLGSGLIYPAPGTWGSVGGLIIGIPLLEWLGFWNFAIFTLITFLIGIYLCQKTTDDLGVHDHGSIVWDEFVGVFITLLAIPTLNWQWCLAAFILFRVFDILKPYPVKYFDEKWESGFGIMIDDVLAAIYAVLVIGIFRWIF